MTKIITLLFIFALVRIFLTFAMNKFRRIPKKELSAEDIIKCRGYHPDIHKKMMDDIIIDYSREEEIEKEYEELRDLFKSKLQNKELSRGKIIGIEQYLRKQLKDNKKYKNNAHAIYTMLKSYYIKKEHISTIKSFLQE